MKMFAPQPWSYFYWRRGMLGPEFRVYVIMLSLFRLYKECVSQKQYILFWTINPANLLSIYFWFSHKKIHTAALVANFKTITGKTGNVRLNFTSCPGQREKRGGLFTRRPVSVSGPGFLVILFFYVEWLRSQGVSNF